MSSNVTGFSRLGSQQFRSLQGNEKPPEIRRFLSFRVLLTAAS